MYNCTTCIIKGTVVESNLRPTQCATGLYIKITHKKIKIINGKNFIRSAIEPESIETAIVQNIIWNSINNANGICGLNWSLTANPTCCSPIKSKFPIKAFPVPKLNENLMQP